MRYPILNNCLEFTKKNSNQYIVYNGFDGSRKVVSKQFVDFLEKFDGKTLPAKIFSQINVKNKKNIDEAMDKMLDEGWIRDNNYRVETFPLYMITMWIPNRRNLLTYYGKSLETLIKVFWVPLFLIGILVWKYRGFSYTRSPFMTILGILLGFIIGGLLHELGHVISAYANKKRVYEVGVGLFGFVPFMYTLIDTQHISTKKELRILATGVKMNLLYAGILFLFASVESIFSSAFETAALANIVFAILNTTMAYGLDGMKAAQYLIFDQKVSMLDTLVTLFTNSEKKREFLAQNGISGSVALINILALLSFQIFYPALYILLFMGGF
ncbi:MAG: hypothetical protein Q4C49_03285 [Bacillota bacterium]|nr:hypothetical protein [Bacillota bacterium]